MDTDVFLVLLLSGARYIVAIFCVYLQVFDEVPFFICASSVITSDCNHLQSLTGGV